MVLGFLVKNIVIVEAPDNGGIYTLSTPFIDTNVILTPILQISGLLDILIADRNSLIQLL